MKAKDKIVIKEKEEDIIIVEDRVDRDNRVEKPMSPTTTLEEDKIVEGQRKINLIWELTQASIAIMVTLAMIFAALNSIDAQEVRSAFFLIVGFYFARTNHQAIGGLGLKANESQIYRGR